jgi:hypothetical protein
MEVRDDMDPADRDPAYFNRVLKHIRGLVFTEAAIQKRQRTARLREKSPRAPADLPVPASSNAPSALVLSIN